MASELLSILPADICREIDQYVYRQWIYDNLPTWQKEHRKNFDTSLIFVRCRLLAEIWFQNWFKQFGYPPSTVVIKFYRDAAAAILTNTGQTIIHLTYEALYLMDSMGMLT